MAGVALLPATLKEKEATAALALAMHGQGIERFWTAKDSQALLAAAKCSASWQGVDRAGLKSFDLCWAPLKTAQKPTVKLQVKLGNKEQEDQEVLLFLADVIHAAMDWCGTCTVCVALVPKARVPQLAYWNRLVPGALGGQGGAMRIVLNPTQALTQQAQGPAWIDPLLGRIAPQTRSQYSKLFSAGTNGKFVGLFRRPGRVEIDVQACWHVAPAGNHDLLVYALTGKPRFLPVPGAAQQSLNDWWP